MRHKKRGMGYLQHRKGVNDFFTQLIRQSAESPYVGLTKWLNSEGCKISIPPQGLLIRPDGYGEFSISESEIVPFFFEYDRGTQTLNVVRRKLERYATAFDSKNALARYCPSSYPKVLVMTTSEIRALNIKYVFERCLKESGASRQRPEITFMISWEDDAHMENLLGRIWYGFGDSLNKYSFLGEGHPLCVETTCRKE